MKLDKDRFLSSIRIVFLHFTHKTVCVTHPTPRTPYPYSSSHTHPFSSAPLSGPFSPTPLDLYFCNPLAIGPPQPHPLFAPLPHHPFRCIPPIAPHTPNPHSPYPIAPLWPNFFPQNPLAVAHPLSRHLRRTTLAAPPYPDHPVALLQPHPFNTPLTLRHPLLTPTAHTMSLPGNYHSVMWQPLVCYLLIKSYTIHYTRYLSNILMLLCKENYYNDRISVEGARFTFTREVSSLKLICQSF